MNIASQEILFYGRESFARLYKAERLESLHLFVKFFSKSLDFRLDEVTE